MISNEDFDNKQIVIINTQKGDKLSFLNDNIIVKNEKNIKLQHSCYKTFAILILGDMSITTGLIKRAEKYDISIVLASKSLRIYRIINNYCDGNTILIEKQFLYNSLDIGKHIIQNKIFNQKRNLQKIRNKSDYVKNTISVLQKYIEQVKSAKTRSEIMGYEGMAAKIYFKAFFNKIKWTKRVPRIKLDFINTTLDIGYTILFNYIDMLLSLYGFNLYRGVLHTQFYMRKSLVCDIVEPFRAVIDAQIKKSISLKQFSENDFQIINDAYILKFENNTKYTKVFLEAINEYKKEIFIYIQSYYRAFMQGKRIEEFPFFEV